MEKKLLDRDEQIIAEAKKRALEDGIEGSGLYYASLSGYYQSKIMILCMEIERLELDAIEKQPHIIDDLRV